MPSDGNRFPLETILPLESLMLNVTLSKGIISEINPLIETNSPGTYSDFSDSILKEVSICSDS